MAGHILSTVWSAPENRSALTRNERLKIEAQIELMIGLLDASDGDCDLEDDDPAGGAAEDAGEAEDWRPHGILLDLPIYSTDQTTGPINENQAWRKWHQELRAA
jgi:hypothetical protein